MRNLGALQKEVLVDVDMAKGTHIAPACLRASRQNGLPHPKPDFMLGRMLNHTKTLLEILDCFDLSRDAAPYGAESTGAGLYCDVPALFAIMSCYMSLVRIYRTTFACLYDSLPYFQSIQADQPDIQLLPDLNFGSFKLSGRLDMQLQILVQVSEDMLCKLEDKFGLGRGTTTRTWHYSAGPTRATGLLWMMLEQEMAEQPPLDQPRGHCGSLKEIFKSIRKELRMDNDSDHGASPMRPIHPEKRTEYYLHSTQSFP